MCAKIGFRIRLKFLQLDAEKLETDSYMKETLSRIWSLFKRTDRMRIGPER